MIELTATVSSIHAVAGSVKVLYAEAEAGKRIRMVAHRDFIIQPGEYRSFAGHWESYKQARHQFPVKETRIADVTGTVLKTFLINQMASGSTIPEIAEITRNGRSFLVSKDVTLLEVRKGMDVVNASIDQYLQHYRAEETVQIISATKCVMEQANRRLQARLLEHASVVPKAPELRIGDRAIYRRNDRRVGLVSGSMGIVVPANEDQVVVDFNNNEVVNADIVIEFENEGRAPLLISQVRSSREGEWYLQHAYAITCHQAQGSEFDCVIVALEKSQLLDQSWLYTATSRAKRKVIFVGDLALIQDASDLGNSAERRNVGIRFDGVDNAA